ncbi:MAG: hypothetical protein J6K92_00685 [Oscillospiraceae bacterium]|nr:hypothetical protein [Oscillospiraceae bacterium]
MGRRLIRSSKNGFAVSDLHIRGDPPDKIVKVSDNEVYAIYGNIKQTWTAEGSGNERYNFVEKLEEVSN